MKYDSIKVVETNQNMNNMPSRWSEMLDREIRTRREEYSMMPPAKAAIVSETNLRFKLYSEELVDAIELLGEVSDELQETDSLDKDGVRGLNLKIIQARRKVKDVVQEVKKLL